MHLYEGVLTDTILHLSALASISSDAYLHPSARLLLSHLQVADEKGDTQIIDILSRHADRATLSIMRSSAVAPEGSFGYQKWQVRAHTNACVNVILCEVFQDGDETRPRPRGRESLKRKAFLILLDLTACLD